MNLPIKILITIILISIFSCKNNPRQDKEVALKNYILNKNIDYNKLSNILILTEEGCPNCNRSFTLLLEEQIKRDNSLLIISAKGTIVDISPFLDSESQKNIIHDFTGEFKELGILDGSNAIFLADNGVIDTIVPIREKRLEKTLIYIRERLKPNQLKQLPFQNLI